MFEKKQPKILVGIPYHDAKSYCKDAMMDAVNNLTYPDVEVIMRWDREEYGGKNNVKKQREFFRKLVLDNDFDYLFLMGVDTIPPKDVIEKLLKHKKDIVGGVYWGRHDAKNGRPEGAVAWIHNLPQSEMTRLFGEKGQLWEVDGMGMDCVLISREVLEKISWMSWEQNDDDYPFYDKAIELGYHVFIDTDIQCLHFFSRTGYTHMAEVKELTDEQKSALWPES